MDIKDRLVEEGYVENSNPMLESYSRYLKDIYNAVIEYGYVFRVDPKFADSPNIGKKPETEYFCFRVASDKSDKFENIMKDLNVWLSKENLERDGKNKDYYVFKSQNNPLLKHIIRGCVKIKEAEKEKKLLNNMGNER